MSHWVLPAGFEGQPFAYVLATVVALALTGVSKGGFGAGLGALSIPVMMLVAPANFALGMWLPLLIYCDILTLRHYPREFKSRPVLLLAPWMLLGILLGTLLLDVISPRTTKLCVGGLAILFVLLDQVRQWLKRRIDRGKDVPPFRPTLWTAAPFGITAGVSTMIAHAAGAVTTIYFLPQRLDKRDFVGTQARFYFVVNTVKVPFYVGLALINAETLLKSLWLVPLAPLFVWLGAALNHRMSPVLFNRVVYLLLGISGAYLLYANA